MRIEKFLLLNVYVGKIECSQINKLFSYKISKEEQKKSICRVKEIMKTREKRILKTGRQ